MHHQSLLLLFLPIHKYNPVETTAAQTAKPKSARLRLLLFDSEAGDAAEEGAAGFEAGVGLDEAADDLLLTPTGFSGDSKIESSALSLNVVALEFWSSEGSCCPSKDSDGGSKRPAAWSFSRNSFTALAISGVSCAGERTLMTSSLTYWST